MLNDIYESVRLANRCYLRSNIGMVPSSENTHDSVPEPARDNGGLGLMLISVSSIVSMAIIGIIAAQLTHSVFGDNLDVEALELNNFSTAAGSEILVKPTK